MLITSIETKTEEIHFPTGTARVHNDALLNSSTYYMKCSDKELLCVRGVKNGIGEHIHKVSAESSFGLLSRELKESVMCSSEHFTEVLGNTIGYIKSIAVIG